ncbi:MAG: BMP family protein [Actinomycetota bacterium]|jgi:basic membrane protein A|nr:BMP family protein [Actinomycetota bacterium]
MPTHLTRKVAVPLAAVAMALTLAVGSSSATTRTSATSNARPSSIKVLRVALVAPSATNDLAFTESMYNALEALKVSQHLQISVSENEFVVADAANVIRQYASEGYNLILAHGSQYGSTVEALAPQFPKVSFAWGTAASTFGMKNIFAYEAASNEGGYVQGYMGAMLSKSHVVGVIGPIATGDAKLYVDGFVAGAKAEDKKITAHQVYTGSFSDDSLMATAAKTFVSDGADVLTGSSQSVVGAIGVAKADHLPWFGTQWTQAVLAPKNVVSSQLYNWKPTLIAMIKDIRAGKRGGATYVLKLGNGGEQIQFNPGYKLAKSIKAKGLALIKAIEHNKIKVPT